jgi:hypothetical protein
MLMLVQVQVSLHVCYSRSSTGGTSVLFTVQTGRFSGITCLVRLGNYLDMYPNCRLCFLVRASPSPLQFPTPFPPLVPVCIAAPSAGCLPLGTRI